MTWEVSVSPLVVVACALVAYVVAYRVYARHLAIRLFELDGSRPTPAHTLSDDIDYVPTNRYVLFGHHYASITGLSPMLGPAIAVIWGWLPATLWVVFGAIFVGAVHDFGALAVSIRARGLSVGKITESLVGSRAKTLFHMIIFFLIALAMGVFIHIVATLFSPEFYPESVLPTAVLVGVAMVMGVATHRHGWRLAPLTVVGLGALLLLVGAGIRYPIVGPSLAQWKWLLLGYGFAASVVPVWLLLQPRDYINSLLLYAGVGAMYLGFFLTNPSFVAPALDTSPEGAPSMVPFVFILIACGAASGFHSLVSSGTSAKQLNAERDARFVGYGAMLGESVLGLMAVLACTAGFVSREAWLERYESWQTADGLGNNIAAFIGGTTQFLTALGLPIPIATTFVAVLVVSFALTSLDSATRVLRYNVSEIGETLGWRVLDNRYVASAVAIGAMWFFAFYEVGGEFAGLMLWQLFATTNQLLAGLALLAVTIYLLRRGKPVVYTLVPMVFMLTSTLAAMGLNLLGFWSTGQLALLFTGGVILVLAVWLALEAGLAVRRYRRHPVREGLEVRFEPVTLAGRGESRSYEGSTQSIRRTTLTRMAMGTRETDQPPLWIATSDLPTSPGHPFYARLTTLLDGHHFDRFVEGLCDRFYAPVMGRPSLAPGRYFRLLLVGYFEGIDSERGMAWRATDSLAVRSFLRLAVDEAPPDHSTIARTRRLIDLETHRAVFTWVQQRLVEAGRLTGKTIAIDATTLEANAAMRSIVRRDTGESDHAFLAGLATASGVETPTREGLARLDRKRKKKTSNTDWTHPHDPDAKVTKMKDGRTHLAHKAEHAVDMETGAIVAVTRQGADVGDTTTIIETAIAATEQVEDAQANVDDRQSLDEIVGEKGYHSNQTLIDLDAGGIRSYVSEPDRGRRDWSKDPEARAPVYGNRRRMRGRRGRRLMRQRGERIERSFAHLYDTGGMRRTHLRGHTNILKRLLIHAGGFNLGLVMRHLIGIGTPRGLAGPRGRCSCDVRGAHGRRPTSAHHDSVVASTHPGRARSARVTGHVCRQLVSGDHLHHGLLGGSPEEKT